MNVVMEQGKRFWLDFEHGVSEWQASETRQTTEDDDHTSCNEENMISSSNDDLQGEARTNELQSCVENKVYQQVPDQGRAKISTRWIYSNKSSSVRQSCNARLVAKGFQDEDACNTRNIFLKKVSA